MASSYLKLEQRRIVKKVGKGFTLIELLIGLAIAIALVFISYPIYANHVLKANRSHALVRMTEIASSLEQYHTIYDTYAGANTSNIQLYDDDSQYQFQLADLSDNQYLLKAIPTGSQEKDTRCGIIILDQTGRKTISGSGSPSDCF